MLRSQRKRRGRKAQRPRGLR